MLWYLREEKLYIDTCAVRLMVAMGTVTLHFVRTCLLLILNLYGDLKEAFCLFVLVELVLLPSKKTA